MGIFQQFPYSNFHEMNLDQIIKIMREMQDEWVNTKGEWASYKDFIDNYFDNLDVSAEVLQALQAMAASGELNTIMDPVIVNETAAWLAEHITPTTPIIDNTLSIAGAGADAKATGDAIRNIDSDCNYLHNTILDFKNVDFVPNTYIANSAVIGGSVDPAQIASGLYESAIIPCVKNQRFIITLDGGASARGYSFVNTSYIQMEVAPDDTNYSNELLIAPDDGYLLCNNKLTQTNGRISEEYFKIEEDIERLEVYENEIIIAPNLLKNATYTAGLYYSTGYGNTASNALTGIYSAIELEPDTTYTLRLPYVDFTWLKQGASVGVKINTLPSFVDNGDNTYSFTTWNTTETIKIFISIADANKNRTFFTDFSLIPNDAKENGFVYIPNLSTENTETTFYVSKSYDSSTPGYNINKFDNVISAVNAVSNSSESNPYKIIIEAGTANDPIIYDEWNTVYGGHVPVDANYVGVQLPSYVTITTTSPTHPDRTVLYFDGHAGINDTMSYDDAYKKCLFHINGKKMGIVVEGVTLRSKDCRYAFHPESGVDGYGVEWLVKNCIIDWQGCPHSSETGWAGTTAVGIGLGYGGKGSFENCKWITNAGVTTAIGGHTNGWNPYVVALPIMPGATINIASCDLGNYNIFMSNAENTNELNNIINFYNVINCDGNNSTGWVEILMATTFN